MNYFTTGELTYLIEVCKSMECDELLPIAQRVAAIELSCALMKVRILLLKKALEGV